MKSYDDETYGNTWAEVYDDLFQNRDDLDLVSETLSKLAGTGPALEFGIGTGRTAIPLAKLGIKVHGIDTSQAMIDKMLAKPGGDEIPITLGSFTDVRVEGSFSLVFIVFSTLFQLSSQEEQVRCFANAAHHLEDKGVFVVEAFVHDRTRWNRGQDVTVTKIDDNFVDLHVAMHDPVRQLIFTQHLDITPSGIQFRPTRLRYAWPSELDLMARLAGLRLRERWSGWNREPFTADSGSHVSVYEKI